MEPSAQPLTALLQDLGQKLERYRISRDLKQAELAELAGVSRSTLVRLEAGQGGTLDTLARVTRALGLERRLLELLPEAPQSPLDPRSETGRPRRRVRRSTSGAAAKPWTWTDEAP